ncbi:MAG: hypothetical protein BWY21_01824 [Parcubacteria group bacterium ADurb.Bin216]|nr:MAG: hypothetical protein BWY21_01824 [Parcubacteria group bacterium ADurb.Bin216]
MKTVLNLMNKKDLSMNNIAVVCSGRSLLEFEVFRSSKWTAIYLINDAIMRFGTDPYSAWVFMDEIMLHRYGTGAHAVVCPKEYKDKFLCWTELVREIKDGEDFCSFTTPIFCKWIWDNYADYNLHLFGVDMTGDGRTCVHNERWFREARWLKKYLPVGRTSIHSTLMDNRVKYYLLNQEAPLSLLSEAYPI